MQRSSMENGIWAAARCEAGVAYSSPDVPEDEENYRIEKAAAEIESNFWWEQELFTTMEKFPLFFYVANAFAKNEMEIDV